DPQAFYDTVQGLENEPEGGARCEKCYLLRLKEAGKQAKAGGFDYFTTTLSISPLKSADKLNRAGEEAAVVCGVPFLPSDFKKKNGFKRSIELSKEYELYRQNYCGCVFSRKEVNSQQSTVHS
ncbi:MAG: epoxyqueuosine reductase QueH, partial [Clostridia bacterium]|nr:epoxyqueuosine reductase QueH [Clostridia bacterium]